MGLERVAVVGAGTMGSGIAQRVASEALPVILVDTSRDVAEAAKARIEKLLIEALERGVVQGPDVDAILARIEPTGDLTSVAEADLVIEAIDEDLDAKRELFARLAEICRPDAVLATNTSSLSVARLCEGISKPERVVGMHFFYHAAKNRLVEVIGHDGTDPAVLQQAWRFTSRIGKTPIASQDTPGFVVNRFFVPWLNEAVRLHEEGHTIPTIDAEAKESFGAPMGPFELMNATGVPLALCVAKTLASRLGDLYAPPERLEAQRESWSLKGEPTSTEAIRDRLWGAVLHAVLQLVSEEVTSPADVDISARVGLRWPLGPFEKMHAIGAPMTAQLATAAGERQQLGTPPALQALCDGGELPEIERVRLTVDDGVATILLNRPDLHNAVDPATLDQLERRFEEAHRRSDVYGIIIAAAGKAFAAGIDTAFLADRMRAGAYEEIVGFTARGQALFERIAAADKRVVCRLDGAARGIGAELALACHAVVASPRASLSFPDTGIGLCPACGGTQRLARRLGRGVARYLLYTGAAVDVDTLETLGLAWRVVENDELDEALRRALDEAPVHPVADPASMPRGLADASRFLAAVPVDGLLDGSLTLPGGVEIMEVARSIRTKAPHALRTVATLTQLGEAEELAAGLAAETEGLQRILRTADALEGILAAFENREPSFAGE